MPISNLEIHAWCSLTETRLQSWELQALRALDGAYLRTASMKGV